MSQKTALLRGINVGGKRKILMADLIKMFEELNFSNVRTYIQSGNVFFDSEELDNLQTAKSIQAKIIQTFEFEVPVMVLNSEEIETAILKNPFSPNDKNRDKLHLTFFSKEPDTEDTQDLESENHSPDKIKIIGKNAYIYCEQKYHKSKLSNNYLEKKLKTNAHHSKLENHPQTKRQIINPQKHSQSPLSPKFHTNNFNAKMKHLNTHYHPDIKTLDNKTIFSRFSTRSITLRGDKILLVYTARYDDYSLPGGGLEAGEDQIKGMIRELQEETGAQNIENIQPFGIYEEYRPWYKEDADIQHMISYCYTCDIDPELGTPNLDPNEIKNGVKALWIDIHEAIEHNKQIMNHSPKKGMSIERETFLLKLIAKNLT